MSELIHERNISLSNTDGLEGHVPITTVIARVYIVSFISSSSFHF